MIKYIAKYWKKALVNVFALALIVFCLLMYNTLIMSNTISDPTYTLVGEYILLYNQYSIQNSDANAAQLFDNSIIKMIHVNHQGRKYSIEIFNNNHLSHIVEGEDVDKLAYTYGKGTEHIFPRNYTTVDIDLIAKLVGSIISDECLSNSELNDQRLLTIMSKLFSSRTRLIVNNKIFSKNSATVTIIVDIYNSSTFEITILSNNEIGRYRLILRK